MGKNLLKRKNFKTILYIFHTYEFFQIVEKREKKKIVNLLLDINRQEESDYTEKF